VLSPTRELAVQTFKFAKDFAKFTDLNIINILGGDPIEAQFEALASRPDIIVATPGRLMHHLREISTFKLNHVELLVFDEADRLFEMGFAEQLNEIVRECPTERQTLLFSATMPKALVQFSRAGLRDPQLIRLDTDSQLSEELRLGFFACRSNEKLAAFLYLVRKIIPEHQITIVFTATRHHSELLHALLQRIGVTSTIVYGTMDQDARSIHLKEFRQGSIRYLIVTDLAARGIDVPLLNNVINFHFPPSPKLFIHRCGRAARQGRIGYAFSLVEPEELAFMVDIHTYLGKNLDACNTNTYAVDQNELFETAGADAGNESAAADSSSVNGGTSFNNAAQEGTVKYTLETMTPAQVHCGVLPQDVVDRENDYVKRSFADDDELSTMFRISENGMKQYRRTRTEASRGGVKTAKAILKDNLIRSIHPLIVGMTQ
jgi:ATP-dependent RNA helicase DDX54/DBP10